jgi:carbon monoxide dehydrogenase subunit G
MASVVLKESFEVRAPVDSVWRFVMDPGQVAACMPGAVLDETVDERTFHGTIRVKVGAITTSYKGRVQLVDVDESAHSVRMTAEGREAGGGTAKGSMSSALRAVDGGRTAVDMESTVEITGRIAQMGRGMIQGVSKELFAQFVASATARLEAAPGTQPAVGATDEAMSILPIVFRTIWSAITGFFKRLFGGGRASDGNA